MTNDEAFKTLRPMPGCKFGEIYIPRHDAALFVEYEYDPGQRAKLYGPPEDCCEEIDPSVTVIHVLIDGQLIDADQVLAEGLIEYISTKLCEDCSE